MEIIIYTDGSSKGNPGDAYSGALIILNKTKTLIGQYIKQATNNVAELSAVGIVLKYLVNNYSKDCPNFDIKIYSDSQYVVNILKGNWIAKKNRDTIKKVKKYFQYFHSIDFFYTDMYDEDSYILDVDSFLEKIPDNGKLFIEYMQ